MSQEQSYSQSADPVKVDPQHYEVEYENDLVRVLRIRYGPHERSVMHGHPPGVLIVLSDCDFRTFLPEGLARDVIGQRGQVIGFDEPFEHLPENMSGKHFEAILVELKERA